MTAHLPRHRLEELALAPSQDAAVQAHLDACPSCSARIGAIRAANAAFLAKRTPDAFARAVVARRQARPRKLPLRFAPYALAAAALLGVLHVTLSDTDAIRYKGGRSLQVFVQRDGHQQSLSDGQPLAQGDQLAFVYSLREPRNLLLLSIDDTGAVSTFANVALAPAEHAQLPVGIELDAHRGEERVFALFSPSPIDEARATEALKAALAKAKAKGEGIAGLHQVDMSVEQASVWFRKP